MLATQIVTVENKSSVVSQADFLQIVAALNRQAVTQFNKSGWVRRGIAPPALVHGLDSNQVVPAGAWNIILLDRSDQQGALGYHDDETGTGIPYAEVFAIDSQQNGSTVSAVASHEMLEMLVDPHVDPMEPRTILRKDTGERYIVEVGDPVQGNDYEIGFGSNFLVSDFALPSWFGIGRYRPCSFRGSVSEPFKIAPQGYMSIQKSDGSWTQIYGEQAKHRPDPDDPA